MSDFLQQMASGSWQRLQAAKREVPEPALLQRALAMPPSPALTVSSAGFDLIAELKLRSPAVGQLKAPGEDVESRVTAYAKGGAAAVSVLTEPSRFDGSIAHLEAAARSLAPLQVPAMRKDFIVDPYQVIEARVAGAGGVLVILRMLPREGTEALLDCARKLGLFVLLEAFDEADLEAMHDVINVYAHQGAGSDVGAKHAQNFLLLAGLNCRDLTTLQIVPKRLLDLAPLLPSHTPRVAESGVLSSEDAARVAAAGYELALVGSALMQGGDPQSLAAAMLKAGRESAARGRGGNDARNRGDSRAGTR